MQTNFKFLDRVRMNIYQLQKHRFIALKRSIRLFILALASALLSVSVFAGCTQSSHQTQHVVRVTYYKFGSPAILRQLGYLDKRLAAEGYSVQWHEFAAGPQSLEALNAGSLDITWTAESPVIFAQAAGTPLVYIATTNPNPQTVVFLVPKGSPAKSIADLKGKKIALQKGSIAQYMLAKALKEVGLQMSDIQPIYLPPADANIAFSQSRIDAWIIWEPFISGAEQKGLGHVLRDGEGLIDVGLFYSTSRTFAKEHPQVLKIYLEEMQKAEIWSKDHPQKWAELLSGETKLDVPTLERVYPRQKFGLLPITHRVVVKQQQVADMYYKLGLIPKRINIQEVILSPEEYAAITPSELTSKLHFETKQKRVRDSTAILVKRQAIGIS
ncbi:MAG: aliphatic sulfonate ABC transporter substrate-binding protein [Chroococcidiopsidaceae cyanobacterium CP_BM_ER_R8_30]|nr:aliphatic sulfonate ABC transporter substrate-binding protein [Chroococcidiopsidaceae cyanobacterium CP_BM_ER_R8_30]